MQSILDSLDACLRQQRPAYYAQLQAGLSDVEITALEAQYQRVLPEDVKALYRWKNGQKSSCYEAFLNNQMFTSLAGMLQSAQLMTGMIGFDFTIKNWWNAHWLPIWSNGGGSHLCYDAEGTFTGQAGQILEYWNRDNDRNVVAPSLSILLKQLIAYYQQTDSEDLDEYIELEPLKGFPLRFYAA